MLYYLQNFFKIIQPLQKQHHQNQKPQKSCGPRFPKPNSETRKSANHIKHTLRNHPPQNQIFETLHLFCFSSIRVRPPAESSPDRAPAKGTSIFRAFGSPEPAHNLRHQNSRLQPQKPRIGHSSEPPVRSWSFFEKCF